MALEFADLEKLPDDIKIVLADGKEITLGEVRDAAKGFVNKRIADLTPREQALVTREGQLAEQEKKVRETVAALASQPPVNTNPPPTNMGNMPPHLATLPNNGPRFKTTHLAAPLSTP